MAARKDLPLQLRLAIVPCVAGAVTHKADGPPLAWLTRFRPWVRPALAWIGVAWVIVAYVGTSFFFGKSSHAFG